MPVSGGMITIQIHKEAQNCPRQKSFSAGRSGKIKSDISGGVLNTGLTGLTCLPIYLKHILSSALTGSYPPVLIEIDPPHLSMLVTQHIDPS